MSADARGNLLNTDADIFIDTIGILLTVCAYAPQIIRLHGASSPYGLSLRFILFLATFNNAQFSDTLLTAAYAWPTAAHPVLQEIGKGHLTGVRAFGAVFGLVQVFVQWLCSVVLLLAFVASHGSKRKTILTITSLHAATVVLTAIKIALPRPKEHKFELDFGMALIHMSNMVIAPASLVLHFLAQMKELNDQHGDPGALSLIALGIQVLATAVLGVRWFLRLGDPRWGGLPVTIPTWYKWAFPAINYVLYAIMCAFLLACYLFIGPNGTKHDDLGERAALLD